jgi:hypothetical protein
VTCARDRVLKRGQRARGHVAGGPPPRRYHTRILAARRRRRGQRMGRGLQCAVRLRHARGRREGDRTRHAIDHIHERVRPAVDEISPRRAKRGRPLPDTARPARVHRVHRRRWRWRPPGQARRVGATIGGRRTLSVSPGRPVPLPINSLHLLALMCQHIDLGRTGREGLRFVP